MTIDEAIKELKNDIANFGGPGTSRICQAERLGVEALKIVRDTLGLRAFCRFELLPGETKE